MTGAMPNYRGAAERVAATVLTINASAKHPGTVDPDLASSYSDAITEAAVALGIPTHPHVVQHLATVLYDLAEFSASRRPEPTIDLVQAFTHHLKERRS